MCLALSIMFDRLGLVSRMAALAVVAGLLTQTALAADAGDTVASLEAKGVKLKKEKDGTVSGVFVGPTSTMTLDDFKAIGKLPALRQLNLSPKEPPLNDETLAALGTLDHAEVFFANGAKFTDEGFKVFATWKNLQRFGLDHWGWFETKDKKLVGPGLAYLSALPKLTSIRLGGCRIDDAAATALAKITSLETLDIQHEGITDAGVVQLATLPKLRSIRLALGLRISDVSLVHLSARPTLEAITIGETWLTYDKGFVNLKKLPGLKLISLEKLIATDEDVAKLRADHPQAEVKWTKPDEETIKKTKAEWERSHAKERGKP